MRVRSMGGESSSGRKGEKLMKIKILLFFFISSISLISCKEKSANDLFESFVQKKLNEKYIVLKTASVNSIESLDKIIEK